MRLARKTYSFVSPVRRPIVLGIVPDKCEKILVPLHAAGVATHSTHFGWFSSSAPDACERGAANTTV